MDPQSSPSLLRRAGPRRGRGACLVLLGVGVTLAFGRPDALGGTPRPDPPPEWVEPAGPAPEPPPASDPRRRAERPSPVNTPAPPATVHDSESHASTGERLRRAPRTTATKKSRRAPVKRAERVRPAQRMERVERRTPRAHRLPIAGVNPATPAVRVDAPPAAEARPFALAALALGFVVAASATSGAFLLRRDESRS